MIVRIVQMTFDPAKVDDFRQIFEESKDKIRAFHGCRHVELWQDTKKSNVFFTHSHWDDEAFLDHYRGSDLFKDVWARTKAMFADKPQAWSLNQVG